MKIVINKCFGGYGLSKEAYKKLGIKWDGFGYKFIDDRSNPRLVKVVEQLGNKASGALAELKVVEIPDDISWEIDDYDGIESIDEVHNSWD
jgi:hypothetical protein